MLLLKITLRTFKWRVSESFDVQQFLGVLVSLSLVEYGFDEALLGHTVNVLERAILI